MGRRLDRATRVRPRTVNPKWSNETLIVPVDPNLPAPRDLKRSQRELFRLEVYDYDWLSQNDFLGHVELSRQQLIALAFKANDQPICLAAVDFAGIPWIDGG